jgi:Tfp pilus assembly protein PilN
MPAYLALAAGYVLLIGVFTGQSIGDRLALGRIEGDIAAATAAAQPRMAERADARNALDAVTRLQALSAYPGQLELFAKILEIVPKAGTKMTAWNYQAGDLEFTVEAAAGVDAPAYVKSLQNQAGFSNVSADHIGGDKILKIKLKVAPQ